MGIIKISKVKEILNCSTQTINRYCKSGKLHPEKTGNSKNSSRLFDEDEVYKLCPLLKRVLTRKNVVYCRVSTAGQKNDLKNQREYLEKWVASSGLVVDEYLEDIGSGINFKRKNFLKLMDMVEHQEIDNIIISYKDRLARFAFEYLEERCKTNGTKIIVVNLPSTSPNEELVEDLMEIIHVFSCKLYGLRKYKNAKDLIDDTNSQNSNVP